MAKTKKKGVVARVMEALTPKPAEPVAPELATEAAVSQALTPKTHQHDWKTGGVVGDQQRYECRNCPAERFERLRING